MRWRTERAPGRGHHLQMPTPQEPALSQNDDADEPPLAQARDWTVHRARITAPFSYLAPDGARRAIPKGPCLVEKMEGPRVEIVWGAQGQNSTALSLDEAALAESRGQLMRLD